MVEVQASRQVEDGWALVLERSRLVKTVGHAALGSRQVKDNGAHSFFSRPVKDERWLTILVGLG